VLEALRRWLRGQPATEDFPQVQRRRSIVGKPSEPSAPQAGPDVGSKKDDLDSQARLAGDDVLRRVLKALEGADGVHVESMATALGGLAGVASQWTMLDAIAKGDPQYAALSVMTVKGANGATYVMGDAINRPLLESENSVWSILRGELHDRGAAEPDIGDIVRYNVSVMGTTDYGRPRYPVGVNAGATPYDYASALWPALLAMHQESKVEVRDYPCIYGCALAGLIAMAGDQGTFNLTTLASLAMESAVSVAKSKP
jgi:hypothetical protein